MERMLEQSRDVRVMYKGGSRKCMVANEGMGLEEVRRMELITGTDLSEDKLWYNLKYNRQILMEVEGDTDVRMIFK